MDGYPFEMLMISLKEKEKNNTNIEMTNSELNRISMDRNSESQNRDKYDCVCIARDSVSDENKYEKNPERYHEMSHVRGKKLPKPSDQGVSSQLWAWQYKHAT